jgi:hypothetical protein
MKMDRDVELTMLQAHAKWMVKMAVAGSVLVLGTFGFLVHDCNKTAVQIDCREAVMSLSSASDGIIKCPDARQTLSFPPGWTWAKCSCPTAEKSAP